jgi:hypothetical protein
MAKKQRGADIRLVGTKLQICNLLAALTAKGFTWQSNEHFYPRIGQQGFFSYYLENFVEAEEPNLYQN